MRHAIHQFKLAAFPMVWLCVGTSHAAIVAQYNFTGSSFASSDGALDSTASDFLASNINDVVLFNPGFDTTYGNASPSVAIPTSTTNGPNGSTSLVEADAIANQDYFAFTIAPTLDPGDALDFTSLTFDIAGRSSGSNAVFFLRSSADGYTATVGTTGTVALANAPSTWYSQSLNLSDDSFLQGVTSAITFRLYVGDSRGSTAYILLDNVALNATTVPEPHTALLAALGLTALFRRRAFSMA